MRPLLIALLCSAAVTIPAASQDQLTENILSLSDSTQHPGVGLEAFAFLIGNWKGEGLGGVVEEFWTPASGGSMNGLFRLVHGDELSVSEHMAIDLLEGRPILRVKHFGGTFEGWEEKDEHVKFPLVKAEPTALYMAGLTIKMEGPDELTYYLFMGEQDGEMHEEIMRYRRVD